MTAFLTVRTDDIHFDLACGMPAVEGSPSRRPQRRRQLLELAAAIVLMIAAVGDMLLVIGPDWLTAGSTPSHQVEPL